MGMARFYMNLRYRDRLFVDECGDELADEHAVHGHTLDTARDLIANGRMDSIRNWFDCSFFPPPLRLDQVVRGSGSPRVLASFNRFLRIGAGSPAQAVLVSTFETSTTRRWPRSVSTLTCMLVPAGTET